VGFIGYGVVIEPMFQIGGNHWETHKIGYKTDEEKAKQAVAKRWISAVNNWGNPGQCYFYVSRDPQLIGKELKHI
jgi:hypothetical protein